jgi:hypothetical protein
LGYIIMAGKKAVFPSEHDGPDHPVDRVGAQFCPAMELR